MFRASTYQIIAFSNYPMLKYFLPAWLIGAPLLIAQTALIHDGDSVAFMGDSITQQGTGSQSGYVKLVESGLKANDIRITVIPAGVSGHKSNQMLQRMDSSVLSKNPTWMTLSCGVNDVWHQERNGGVQLPEYQKNMTEIVELAEKKGIKVMILTATLIGEDLESISNTRAIPYNDFLRKLAKERNLPLADLNEEMRQVWKEIQAAGSKQKLTTDGVHMNYAGNLIMARGVLKAFGLSDAQMLKAEEYWKSIPGLVQLTANISLSLDEVKFLEKQAGKEGLRDYLSRRLEEAVKQDLVNRTSGAAAQ